MAIQNGVINTSTGNVLRYGNEVNFENDGPFDSDTETYKTDIPCPAKYKGQDDETMVTRWAGSELDEVAQP